MPRYTYLAKFDPYKTIQGIIEAQTKQEAINKLTRMGYYPIEVKPEVIISERERFLRFKKVTKKEVLLFTQQLSRLIDSGVNITNSLNIISRQLSNKYLKAILQDVIAKIKDGKSLSDSLALYPDLFSNLYSSMIRTGEVSGNLNEVLRRLSNFLEREARFKNYLRTALTYPVFLLIVSVITIFILLLFIIPRIITMFEDMGQVLPLPTMILVNISSFLRNYSLILLAGSLVFIFFLRRLYQNPQFRLNWDRLKLKLMIFGPIILKTELSRLSRTLSLLLSSGVPIAHSLEISAFIVGNQILKSEVKEFKEQIKGGGNFSDSIKTSKFFPEFVADMVRIGEETGALDRSLMRIADDYESEVEDYLKAITQMFEPLVILIMGLIVGFIVISMLLPIFQINLIIR